MKNPRKLSLREKTEIKNFHRLVSDERFKANLYAGNTALLSVEGMRGQKTAMIKEQEARFLEGIFKTYMARKLKELGYPQGTQVMIDPESGNIIEVKIIKTDGQSNDTGITPDSGNQPAA